MKTKSSNKYASEIRSIRAFLGLSQSQLASMLGITFRTISNYENGNTPPKVAILDRLRAMRDKAELDQLNQ